MFADDAKIFSLSNDALQLALDNFYQCLTKRKLKSYPEKLQILNICKSKTNPSDLLINKTKLLSATVFKDLGIQIRLKI